MEAINDILVKRGYATKQAVTVASELEKIDLQLQKGLQTWLTEGKETDYTIGGVKLSKLKQKFDMTYPAALLTMDWLIKEPELAIRSINRGVK